MDCHLAAAPRNLLNILRLGEAHLQKVLIAETMQRGILRPDQESTGGWFGEESGGSAMVGNRFFEESLIKREGPYAAAGLRVSASCSA